MKKNIISMLILVPALVLGAIAVEAYSLPPTFPNDTNVVPVTVGTPDQVKTGGLSVEAFVARDKAMLLGKNTFITGTVRGGVAPSLGTSTVYFGDVASGATVTLGVEENVQVTDSSERLISGVLAGSGVRVLCANDVSEVFVCN